MIRGIALSCLLTAFLAGPIAAAENVSVTVHPDRVLNNVGGSDSISRLDLHV